MAIELWSDEDTATLLRLWEIGRSATDIASSLKGNYSRNAVLGKIHRLKASTVSSQVKMLKARRNLDHMAMARAKLRERDRIKKQRKRDRIKAETRRSLSTGTSKTSPTYRNLLPKAPEMTKNELRALISEAMRNTAALAPVMEAAE